MPFRDVGGARPPITKTRKSGDEAKRRDARSRDRFCGERKRKIKTLGPRGQVIQAETPISATPEHRLGFYYIQDAASMLPAELFDLSGTSAPLILDLAASPGGKTTHITARTGDRGLVIANDSSPDRITALRIVLSTWGSINNAITHFPGEKFGTWFPETFDYVLLDAPCSMQGIRTTA